MGASQIVNSLPFNPKRGKQGPSARTLKLGLDCLRELQTLNHQVEGLFRCEDHVEIGHVYGAADAWFEWQLDLLLHEAPPVDLLKERMVLDLLCAIYTQTLHW